MNNPYGINEYQWALNMLWEGIGKREFYISYKELMQGLVDKAIPEEVCFNQGLDISKYDGDCRYVKYTNNYYTCPNCDSFLCIETEEDSQGDYCPHCGQRLEWGV